jgi:hypothetical protein
MANLPPNDVREILYHATADDAPECVSLDRRSTHETQSIHVVVGGATVARVHQHYLASEPKWYVPHEFSADEGRVADLLKGIAARSRARRNGVTSHAKDLLRAIASGERD